MINFSAKIKALAVRARHLFRASYLPIALIIIFVLQNNFFSVWLGIPLHPYLIRRLVVTASLGLLLFGPALWLNKWVKYLYLSLISLFVALIFIFQFLYYSYSGGFLQATAFFYAGEGAAILATVRILLTYRLVFFTAGLLVVIAAWILTRYKIVAEKISGKNEKIVGVIIVLVFAFSGYGYLFFCEHAEAGTAADIYQYSRLYDVNTLVSKVGIINFSLGDVLTLGLHTDKATAADLDFIESYKEQRATTTFESDFGMLKGRNLIFIQVESLENAVIGQKIYGQEITPNLNKLANEGLYFSNYYAPVGPGTTADAEFMTLNSFYSLPDTVAFVQYAYDHYTALPGLLKENGYHTYSFHGDVPSFWNRANIYPQLGYEKWFGRKDYEVSRNIGAFDLGDEDFFEQSVPKLESLPQPFMATLITLSSHTPFQLPPDLETMNIPATTTLDWLQQHYLQSIHYTDQAIGDFIDQLKSAGLYDNSLILIYGDHGSFTDISGALGVENSVFPDLQTAQVPLIMLAPGSSLRGEKNTPGSHLDVYPTVADLLGLTLPPDIFGHDLVEGNNAVVTSRNLVSGTVTDIVTDKRAYHSAGDGIFEHGTCLEMPSEKKLAVGVCQSLYNEQENAVKASDLMVKENLIDTH